LETKRKKLLLITSSGGGGHIQAAKAHTVKTLSENPKIETIELLFYHNGNCGRSPLPLHLTH